MTANAMGITWPWLRRIKVTFEGLSSGPRDPFESTGKQDGLRITAKIQKAIQGIPPSSVLTFYNLSQDTRRSFQRDTTKVRIEAGWDEGPKKGLAQCFYGSLLSAVHNRAGTDIVTTINAVSMVEDLARLEICKTWVSGYPVRLIVLELAQQLPNVWLIRFLRGWARPAVGLMPTLPISVLPHAMTLS